MSAEGMRDLVARLATEPALGRELEADPTGFGRQHQLSDDEVAMLRSFRRPGTAGEGPQALRERLSRSGLVFGGALGALANDIDVESPVAENSTEVPVAEGSTGTSVPEDYTSLLDEDGPEEDPGPVGEDEPVSLLDAGAEIAQHHQARRE